MPREEDKQFGEAALRLHVVAPERLEELYVQLDSLAGSGTFVRLNDLMVERGLITEAQRQQVEAVQGSHKAARQIGGFEIERKIGQGGMASVYRARQLSMDRPVALKILHSKFTRKPKYIERFFHEARASAKLSHVNIVQGIDVGQSDGFYYFAMELIDGETLKDRLDREGIVPEAEAANTVMAVAGALDYAFRQAGIIHRDIKPGNILIARDGVPKVCDLGLAKTLDAEAGDKRTAPMGTPHYMSPEQVRGLPDIDTRADIYSLGATFYHMVTGTTPYEGNQAQDLMKKHVTLFIDPPETRNPNLSPSVCYVISRMIAKRRKERYQTMAEVAADLQRIAEGKLPEGLAAGSLWSRLPHIDTKLVLITAGMAAAAAILALILVQMLGGSGEPQPRPEPNGEPPVLARTESEAAYLAAIDYGTRFPNDTSGRLTRLEEVTERYPDSPEAGFAENDIRRLYRHVDALRERERWESRQQGGLAVIDTGRRPYNVEGEQPLAIPGDIMRDRPDDPQIPDNGDEPVEPPVEPPPLVPQPPADPIAALRLRLDAAVLSWHEHMIARRYDKAAEVLDGALPAELPGELEAYRGAFEHYRQLLDAMAETWTAVWQGAQTNAEVLYDGRLWRAGVLDANTGILTLKADTEQKNVDLHDAPLGLIVGLMPAGRMQPKAAALLYYFDDQHDQARNLLLSVNGEALLHRLERDLPRLNQARRRLTADSASPVQPTGQGDEAEATGLFTMLVTALEANNPLPAAVYQFTDALLTRYGNNNVVRENLDLIQQKRREAIAALQAGGQWERMQEAAARPMVIVNPAEADGINVFATVAEAIAAAEEGGLVEIAAGTYNENLEIFDKKDLLIRPRQGDWVVLRGDAARPAVSTLYVRGGERLTFQNLVITGTGFLVNVENSTEVVIDSCWIVNARAPREEAAVEFRRSQNCRLQYSIVQSTTRGVNLERSQRTAIEGNLFLNTTHAAVEMINSAQSRIVGNIIHDADTAYLTDADTYRANAIDRNLYRNTRRIVRDLVRVHARTLEEARAIGGTDNDLQSADTVAPAFKDPAKGDYRIGNAGAIANALGLDYVPGPRWNELRWWLAINSAPVARGD